MISLEVLRVCKRAGENFDSLWDQFTAPIGTLADPEEVGVLHSITHNSPRQFFEVSPKFFDSTF